MSRVSDVNSCMDDIKDSLLDFRVTIYLKAATEGGSGAEWDKKAPTTERKTNEVSISEKKKTELITLVQLQNGTLVFICLTKMLSNAVISQSLIVPTCILSKYKEMNE